MIDVTLGDYISCTAIVALIVLLVLLVKTGSFWLQIVANALLAWIVYLVITTLPLSGVSIVGLGFVLGVQCLLYYFRAVPRVKQWFGRWNQLGWGTQMLFVVLTILVAGMSSMGAVFPYRCFQAFYSFYSLVFELIIY